MSDFELQEIKTLNYKLPAIENVLGDISLHV